MPDNAEAAAANAGPRGGMQGSPGLAVADKMSLDAVLSFPCMFKAREKYPVRCAFDALDRAWHAERS